MPRPRKLKKIDSLPQYCCFAPLQAEPSSLPPLTMTVEEYETIRLIDLEGLTQEECAAAMDIARTTVQGIYASARKTFADFLVNGRQLRIEGGEYCVCGRGRGRCCGAGEGVEAGEHPQRGRGRMLDMPSEMAGRGGRAQAGRMSGRMGGRGRQTESGD